MATANKPELRDALERVNEQITEKKRVAQEKWTAFEQKRDEFAAAGSDVSRTDDAEFKAADDIHKEYTTVAEELKGLENRREGIFRMIGKDGPRLPEAVPPGEKTGRLDEVEIKAPSQRVLESQDYKALVASGALGSDKRQFGTAKMVDLPFAETKALITGVSDTSGGAFITNERIGYVSQPQRPLRIIDLVTTGQTGSDTVEFARQTAYTSASAIVAEATTVDTGTKPQATLAFEKVTAIVETLAIYAGATRRALADVGQMRTLIDSQLRYDVLETVERQVVSGSGSGQFTGITNTSNILSQAKGGDSVADCIHKAITQIRLGFIEPNGVALHPNDWQVLRLSRDDSGAAAGTGGYLYGPPAMAAQPTIWGLPVAVSAAVPDDTGVVGDWSKAVLWLREGLQLFATDSHSDWFIKNLIAILAEMRAAFGVLLPQAFCKCTSLD